MASKTANLLLTILAEFVRQHPKTSATLAFNLGVIAAGATKKAQRSMPEVREIPAKLIELVPSLKDVSGYLPALPGTSKAPKPRRRKKRKPAARAAGERRSARA